jgi:hypothetical protein
VKSTAPHGTAEAAILFALFLGGEQLDLPPDLVCFLNGSYSPGQKQTAREEWLKCKTASHLILGFEMIVFRNENSIFTPLNNYIFTVKTRLICIGVESPFSLSLPLATLAFLL